MKAPSFAAAVALAIFVTRSVAASPEHVVQGSLPASEGFVVAGALVGTGDRPVHLELARMVTDPLSQHGCAWSWRTVDLRPGERFRFVGVPPGRYMLWTPGRRVEAFDVFADHLDHEFRAPGTTLRGCIRPAFESKGERMTIEFARVDGKGETRFEVAPRAEFETPPLSPGRHAVEVWWNQLDRSWWDDPRRWAFVDVTPDPKRFDFDLLPAADVTLLVRSAGRAETFEGRVFDADLPDAASYPFRVEAEGDRTLGTCVFERGPFGADFGPPRVPAPLRNVPAGTHRLRFVAPGFETLERTVEVGEGRTPVDVSLTPIPGTFVVAEGWGLFEVFVRPAAAGPPDEAAPWRGLLFGDNRNIPTHTDPMRPRELLPPGKWEFLATTEEQAPSSVQTIELGADHAEVKIALTGVPGATLHGRLRTASGVALAGTETSVFVREGNGWRRLRAKAPQIDERGASTVPGLAGGTYRITYDEAGRHAAGEFDVEDRDVKRDFVFRAR